MKPAEFKVKPLLWISKWPLVRANADKPHRCPACHSIPEKARVHGHARWWAIYGCPKYKIRWWRGWKTWGLYGDD